MKRGTTGFLKLVLLMVAVGVVAMMIRFPQTEGRAQGLSLLQIYADPLIIYIYIGSIPFFVGLFQAFKLLQLIDANRAFSKEAVKRLRNIKLVSILQIGFIVAAQLYLRFFANGDDPTGPIMLGFMVSFAIAVIATAAAVFEKLFKNAVDLKSENELTI